MDKNTGSKLLFLALGAALGAAVGYVAASEKKEQWVRDIHGLVDKIKCNAKSSISKDKDKIEDIVD